jgi:NAD(P)-dependent dehydrogenase (short-subunit alcohol dehydrogenase family)
VSVPADLDQLYATVQSLGSGLDIVVANAGLTQVASLELTTEEHLDTLFGTNVKGVVFTVQKALPLLNPGASIVVVGSVAGERGRAGIGAYAASKAAVRSFVRTWANELAPRGFRVNLIVTGSTATPGIDALAEQTSPGTPIEEFRAGRVAGIPLGRFAEPTEIANAAVFLASDLSSFTTGAAIAADGGANQI